MTGYAPLDSIAWYRVYDAPYITVDTLLSVIWRETMPTTELELDCTLSVNDVIMRYPATIAVFNRFGVDTCCGGILSVEAAACANDVDREALCAQLHDAVRRGSTA
jgi:hypothetical protein